MDGKRRRGVLFLFGYFLFEHAKISPVLIFQGERT